MGRGKSGYNKLNEFLQTYCPNMLCKDCQMRRGNKCGHPMRPKVKLLQNILKRGEKLAD